MYRRKYLAISGGIIGLAGCNGSVSPSSGGSSSTSDAEATIREYINAFCNEDVETVNELQSEYGIEDDVTESELTDADCGVSNLQEQSFPAEGDSERFLEKEAITDLKYYTFTLTIDGETQETSVALALENGEWKVLDIG